MPENGNRGIVFTDDVSACVTDTADCCFQELVAQIMDTGSWYVGVISFKRIACDDQFLCDRFDPGAKKLQYVENMTFNACATIDEYRIKPLRARLVGNFRIFRAEELSPDSMNKLFSADLSQEFKVSVQTH